MPGYDYLDDWCDYCKEIHRHTCDRQREENERERAIREAKEKIRIEQEIVAFEAMIHNMGEERFTKLMNNMGFL